MYTISSTLFPPLDGSNTQRYTTLNEKNKQFLTTEGNKMKVFEEGFMLPASLITGLPPAVGRIQRADSLMQLMFP